MRVGRGDTSAADCARTFSFHTEVSPGRVWSALTDSAQTPAYLYGLRLSSTWTTDAPIEGTYAGHERRIDGQVLCSWPGQRLSYLLHETGGVPVYLTWLVRESTTGSIGSLRVDEADGSEDRAELEDAWLPVVAALQRWLACG